MEYNALSHPNKTPAVIKITAFNPRTRLNPSTLYLDERKIEIKSVPPVVVSTIKHKDIASPFNIPPNTLINKISEVNVYFGIISTSTLFNRIINRENNVKFLPIYLNPMYTGNAFQNTFTNV